MANEIVTLQFSRRGKSDASGSIWSGLFLYPIDPVIQTQQNVLVVPSPAGFLPGEAVQYSVFSADEIAEFNAGTLLYVGEAVELTAEQDSSRANLAAALRAAYVAEDRDQRSRMDALRRQYRQFGVRINA